MNPALFFVTNRRIFGINWPFDEFCIYLPSLLHKLRADTKVKSIFSSIDSKCKASYMDTKRKFDFVNLSFSYDGRVVNDDPYTVKYSINNFA